jgi:pyruvate/2-oxoglutarate dehydrogenase complex dihydrolipoamide dehydrogenase (E3) component
MPEPCSVHKIRACTICDPQWVAIGYSSEGARTYGNVYTTSRVGQFPAGPMGDRRTKRDRDRSTRERRAIERDADA